jgi:hypothetical protein
LNPNPNHNNKPQPNPNPYPNTKPQPKPNPNFTNWEVAKEVNVLLNAKKKNLPQKILHVPWHLIRFIFMNRIMKLPP